MPPNGIYFIPHPSNDSPPLRDFLGRFTAIFNPTPLPRWTLDHRLFRETPKAASADPTAGMSVRYLQILAFSHDPGSNYVAITNTNAAASQTRAGTMPAELNARSTKSSDGPATIVTIPSGQATEDFYQFLVTKFVPLWTARSMLSVPAGLAYEVGDFRIRVGELKQGSGSAQVIRGIVVEIYWAGGEDGDMDEAELVIRAFWDTLRVKGAREVFQVPGLAEGNGTVRQWCEILRLRG